MANADQPESVALASSSGSRGLPLRDRYVPHESVWENLPIGLPLQVQILRLPTIAELVTTPLSELALDVSPRFELYREEPLPAE